MWIRIRLSDTLAYWHTCFPFRTSHVAHSTIVIDYLHSPSAEKVVIDGAVGQQILCDDMKNAGVKIKPYLPKVEDVVNANALFEQLLFAGKILHSGQPSLTQIVSNCEHRNIGTGGGFGYTSLLEQADAGLIESVTLAHWAAALAVKVRKKQTSSL